MPHLGAFVPSNYFAFIYVPVYNIPYVYYREREIPGVTLLSWLALDGGNPSKCHLI
jgi:hypothetical protein